MRVLDSVVLVHYITMIDRYLTYKEAEALRHPDHGRSAAAAAAQVIVTYCTLFWVAHQFR